VFIAKDKEGTAAISSGNSNVTGLIITLTPKGFVVQKMCIIRGVKRGLRSNPEELDQYWVVILIIFSPFETFPGRL